MQRVVTRFTRELIIASALLFLVEASASAQYFGQNKVQHRDLDFQVLKTEHFDIYFYPEERAGIEIAARLAERWHARLERILRHQLRGRQPLILYASHPDFEGSTVVPGPIGEGTGGLTEPLRRRIVLPFGGPLADTDHVIGHELVHAFQFDITTSPDGPPGEIGATQLPLWFIEGMAEYLSLGPVDTHTAMWMRDAVRAEELPAIKDLDHPKYFPYRWGHAFWAYVTGRWGDEVVSKLLAAGGISGVDDAVERVLGIKTEVLSADWQAALRRAYGQRQALTPPDKVGRRVLGPTGSGGDLNVGPAISPDGRRIAFLSERSFLSIDLYVAETESGRILHKLTSTATDPHFTSLQFIHSAGAWDSSSRNLAVATLADHRPALVVFDAESGDRTREIRIAQLDEIFNPTWAPDGAAIAFTGMSGGLTDLYLYDLTKSVLRRLTNDVFAELQPAWSPDGRRIAFATDRYSSRIDALVFGTYRLAVVDVASGRVEEVGGGTGGKAINPQWSPDGKSIYFLSDRDGITNLYRLSETDGAIAQLTRVSTGLTGITGSSPAMSVATRTNVAAFSVYDTGNYAVHTLDLTDAGVPASPAAPDGDLLPPADRRPSVVAELLESPTFGLTTARTADVAPYRPKLELEGLGQPMVAVGANRFGAVLGGGLSLTFSDMLNTHFLGTALQFNSGIGGNFSAKDTAFQVAYFNQARRWTWGVVGGQIPYLSGGFLSGVDVVNNQLVGVDQTILFRQTERSASGVLSYPFSRARRIEFQGGVTQLSFDQVVETITFNPQTGGILDERQDETSRGPGLTLGTAAAAFVSDTSAFGATSPVAGERFRLELSPTFGSINYASLLADYRRYFMPVPFYTLAGRILHYGRYGSGAADARLFPLYIGYPTLVRGYDVNSFGEADCVADATSACPAFDRLQGSRMLVANLEFRFPLLRPFGATSRMYGPIPIEVALFGDGGIAWGDSDDPTIFGGSRDGVASVGIALRANLLGFAIGEFDFTRPLQRPGRGWVFQFNLAPGF